MTPKQWIVRSPKVLNGIPVFANTRVPVQTLLEYLEAGQSIQEFLDDYPTVDYKHVSGALKSLKQLLLSVPKRNLTRGVELSRGRSIRRLHSAAASIETTKNPIENRKHVSSVEESKYEVILSRLRRLGWKPSQLAGRGRTEYKLNSRGNVLAIFRNAKKQKRGREFLYFFGLSRATFEKYVSQGRMYVFLQCGGSSSALVIPGSYFQQCFQGVPTSGGDWKINLYTDGKTWELQPSGKSRIEVTEFYNNYPGMSSRSTSFA
jgi:uncharacterized protein (DUF433 family)